ncbi:MAG: hypothetical protein WDO12_01920 [Pseudomonadota bacterium]
MNNGDTQSALGFIAADPVQPTAGIPATPFSFGAIPQGAPYKIEVRQNPFGRICTVTNGSGTITTAEDLAAHPIAVSCVNNPAVARYDLTVNLPTDPALFTGLPGAAVNVKTEDQIYSKAVTSGQTSVTFPGVLVNAATEATAFKWTVLANINEADGSQSKCVVTGPTGTNPTANVATPSIGIPTAPTQPACKFTISGSVAYSVPPGGAAAPMPTGGLTLEVRDVQGKVMASQNVTTYGSFTFGGTTPSLFSSNTNAVYDIAVATQPAGQTCVVGDGGGVNFYTTGSNNPVNVTSGGTMVNVTVGTTSASTGIAMGSRLNVFCRAAPAAAAVLKGTYRLMSSIWTANVTVGNPPTSVTSTYTPYDLTVQNTASSNMITFFDDGTFLYATHAANNTQASTGNPLLITGSAFTLYPANQVEHGFYDYDPANQKIRFTLITDTNGGTTFPTNFAPTQSPAFFGAANTLTTTNGLSAAPGAIAPTPAGVGTRSAAMTRVVVGTGTPRTITGRFGEDPAATTATNSRLDWVLTEPASIDHEMTGTWISQDHRRFWTWDFADNYGYHVGVEGGAASINDSCFTMEDLHASSGIYTRRIPSVIFGSSNCSPFSRISTAMFTAGTYGLGSTTVPPGVESIDFNTGTWISPAIASTGLVPLFTNSLPGFIGRFPGGQASLDGRSPSPNYFAIATPATFFNTADPTYFPQHFPTATSPATSLSWCTTEILGVRATSNGIPINSPVYFCRTRAP